MASHTDDETSEQAIEILQVSLGWSSFEGDCKAEGYCQPASEWQPVVLLWKRTNHYLNTYAEQLEFPSVLSSGNVWCGQAWWAYLKLIHNWLKFLHSPPLLTAVRKRKGAVQCTGYYSMQSVNRLHNYLLFVDRQRFFSMCFSPSVSPLYTYHRHANTLLWKCVQCWKMLKWKIKWFTQTACLASSKTWRSFQVSQDVPWKVVTAEHAPHAFCHSPPGVWCCHRCAGTTSLELFLCQKDRHTKQWVIFVALSVIQQRLTSRGRAVVRCTQQYVNVYEF